VTNAGAVLVGTPAGKPVAGGTLGWWGGGTLGQADVAAGTRTSGTGSTYPPTTGTACPRAAGARTGAARARRAARAGRATADASPAGTQCQTARACPDASRSDATRPGSSR
jgi:hypothetical protein